MYLRRCHPCPNCGTMLDEEKIEKPDRYFICPNCGRALCREDELETFPNKYCGYCGTEIASVKKKALAEKEQETETATWNDEDNHVKRACEHYGISDEEQRKGFLLFKTRDELFRLLYGVNAMQLQTSSKRFSATIHYDAEWEDWAITIDEYDTNQEGKV